MKKVKKKKRFMLSVTEECVLNPAYFGFRGGRIEIYDNESESGYAVWEFRFFVPDWMMNGFRKMVDFKYLTEKEMRNFRIDIEGGRIFDDTRNTTK